MSEWTSTTVGAIAALYDGPHATPEKKVSGPWFLSISSLDGGRLNLNESAHVSEADFEIWTRRIVPKEGDVLFSYETRLGEAASMPTGLRACLGRRMALLRPDRAAVDPRFLLYVYLAPQFQNLIRERTIHGATVNRIPLVEMPQWPIRLPPLDEQRAISEVLGALDDKIAVNDQICIAYDSWLRTRFAQLSIDSYDARHQMRVDELVTFNPRLSIAAAEDAAYLDMAAVPTEGALVRGWIRRPAKPGTRFTNGDTVMARITPCLENGKTAFIDFLGEGEVGTGSTEFIVMRARPGLPLHLPYFLARSPRFRDYAIARMSGSSGRQRVSADDLLGYLITNPDQAALSEFGHAASAAFAHMRSLNGEARSLAGLRDAILPKLISGEIRVRAAENTVEDAT